MRSQVLETPSFEIFKTQLDELLSNQLWLRGYSHCGLWLDWMIPNSSPTSVVLWANKHLEGLDFPLACCRNASKRACRYWCRPWNPASLQPSSALLLLSLPFSTMMCRESGFILSASASFWPKYTPTHQLLGPHSCTLGGSFFKLRCC